MKPIRIAPSILAGDLGNLRRAVDVAVEGGADQIHLDVIDGHFAPNITFGPGTVRALRKLTDMTFDTHLMISEPEAYAKRFIDAGSDLLPFHAEVLTGDRFDALYQQAHAAGKQIGLAIKPATSLPEWSIPRLGRLGCLVVMTVNPGFSGQSMDRSVLPKLEAARDILERSGSPADIEVDGGVEPENVHEVVKRGANVLVAGAGVYAAQDPIKRIGLLRQEALAARSGV